MAWTERKIREYVKKIYFTSFLLLYMQRYECRSTLHPTKNPLSWHRRSSCPILMGYSSVITWHKARLKKSALFREEKYLPEADSWVRVKFLIFIRFFRVHREGVERLERLSQDSTTYKFINCLVQGHIGEGIIDITREFGALKITIHRVPVHPVIWWTFSASKEITNLTKRHFSAYFAFIVN